ncbi:MAG: hypothetical protein NTV51_10690 [Verrucomicrobia bacterium]|nr:hypothetical protein [Verrucomicrobiota bacterium]
MLLHAFTLFHVLISLVGIVAGSILIVAFLQGRRADRWTNAYFATTVATSATGFLFPVERVLPSHIVGLISLVILGVTTYGYYRRRLSGAWRKIHVVGVTLAFYLNVFVAVIQSFLNIPVLKSLAPTQTEPVFKFTQLAVLLLFFGLGVLAFRRFRPERNAALMSN